MRVKRTHLLLRSLRTHSPHDRDSRTELTSLAVTTTFFPAAVDQLVYGHGKDLQQQRHHVMPSVTYLHS